MLFIDWLIIRNIVDELTTSIYVQVFNALSWLGYNPTIIRCHHQKIQNKINVTNSGFFRHIEIY